MTRRERLERKVERRREWAAGRSQKAAGLRAQNEPLRGDWAFTTQPGHIPERARANKRDERAFEHSEMADHHEAKADGLEAQLERTVFSDDADAVQQLERRIAEREALQAHMRAVNAAIKRTRKADPAANEAAILIALVKAGAIPEAEGVKLARSFALCPYQGLGYPSYATTNNNANIRRDRQRIDEIKRQTQRQAEAEAAPGGVVITTQGDYCSVRFAERPARDILDALRAAGFFWGSGVWSGTSAKIPECVSAMQAEP